MAEEEIVPKVEEVAFAGKLTGSLEDIKSKADALPFFSSKIEDNVISIVKVESRNIKKKPFLFYIVKIRQEGMDVIYSIAPDTSERLRRLTVMKNVASLLSMITDYFQIDQTRFFQYIDSVIDDVLNSLSQSYSTLFNKYDALLTEYREYKRLNLELTAANRNLTIQAAQLKNENDQLKAELNALKTYSDESLMSMVQDWIETHNNSIDIDEFAKNYNVPAPRVEQILDKMVSLGYIELKS